MSDFLSQVMSNYSKIKFPKEYQSVAKLDGPIAWYLADSTQKYIYANGVGEKKYILDIDIKSAFPTICNNLLYDINPDFVQKMNQIQDKKSRNIFIATSLVSTNYLKQLNIISKMIILGYIFDIANNDDILLLELKKDGCVILTTQEIYDILLYDTDRSFAQFCEKHNFIFHIDTYLKYIRSNRTSLFFDKDYNIKMKGIYKYMPDELFKVNKRLLLDENFDLNYLSNIYNSDYFYIIKRNNLYDLLKKYYICNNDKILGEKGAYEIYKHTINIEPRLYLKTFIFPVLLSQKIN